MDDDLTDTYAEFGTHLVEALARVEDPVERFHAALVLAQAGRKVEGRLADVRGSALRELQARGLSLAEVAALVGVTRARVQALSRRGV